MEEPREESIHLHGIIGPGFDLLVGRGEDSRIGILLGGTGEDKEANKRGTNLSWSR